MEDIKSFRGKILNLKGSSTKGEYLRFKDAHDIVLRELDSIQAANIEESERMGTGGVHESKTKTYLNTRRQEYREHINQIVRTQGFNVIGYEGKINEFVEEVMEEVVGYSILSDAMNDPDISDIFVLTWDKIYVEKNGENELYHKTFRSEDHFSKVLRRFLNEAGQEINSGDKKIVDFELYGDRGCAVDKSVAPKGTSLTLRKHSDTHITKNQLVSGGVLTEQMADFLGMLIVGETNLICAGLTGSGKTTTLRALIDHYVPMVNKRMLVCEDTQELFPDNDHTLEMISMHHHEESQSVSLNELILTALRQKPKYIIVGEVRGLEAEAAVEAMETGHSTMFTMHGGQIWNVINRLVTKYITSMPSLGREVVERIIGSAVDYVFIQSNVPNVGRKIVEITEVNYDYENNRISTTPIFRFNHLTQDWVLINKIAPDKASKMIERGIPIEDVRKWIDQDKFDDIFAS